MHYAGAMSEPGGSRKPGVWPAPRKSWSAKTRMKVMTVDAIAKQSTGISDSEAYAAHLRSEEGRAILRRLERAADAQIAKDEIADREKRIKADERRRAAAQSRQAAGPPSEEQQDDGPSCDVDDAPAADYCWEGPAGLAGSHLTQRKPQLPRRARAAAGWRAARPSLLAQFYRAAAGRSKLVLSRIGLCRASVAPARCCSVDDFISRRVDVTVISIDGIASAPVDVQCCARCCPLA